MGRQRNRGKKSIQPGIIALSTILVLYLCTALYFKNHFYFRTTINGIKASGKTVEEVTKELEDAVKNYTLQLEGRDNTKEKLSAKDFKLKYNTNNEISLLKKSENPFNIFKGIFKKKQYKVSRTISYDENQLKECIDKMAFFDKDKIVNPKNASIEYKDNGYEIEKEVMGNKVNYDKLCKEIKNAITSDTKILNLDKSNCYDNPKYTAKSKEVVEAKKTMNKYLKSTITYDIRGNKEVLDASTLKDWIKTDNDFNVYVDKQKVKSYLNKLGYTYDTVGKTRDFITATGQHVKVNGGSYGWSINRTKESEELIQAIKDGKSLTKKPVYSQVPRNTGDNEIGNTYVEIDLTKQHLWFFKDGKIIANGDIVTGSVAAKHETPEGVYKLNYKEKNAVLRGENYAAPVDFWMPFNGGIGMHDAKWKKQFGKEVYKTNGSHGCVNCPYDLAKAIFENIESGTPIICHY